MLAGHLSLRFPNRDRMFPLQTLDSDYSKNEEGLLGVLCHILSVKSLELILSAAAATGKLRNFATKLIKLVPIIIVCFFSSIQGLIFKKIFLN